MLHSARVHLGRLRCVAVLAIAIAAQSFAAEPITLTVKADQPGAKLTPLFYGLMTEEINHSYDGGIYGELIQNRIFQDTPPRGGRRGAATEPAPASAPSTLGHWSIVAPAGSGAMMAVDTVNPVNDAALKNSLRLDVSTVGNGERAGVANDGYWGIPVKPSTQYKASFYARASASITGPLTVSIESPDGKTTFASATVAAVSDKWQQYKVTLKTADVKPTTDARFVISTTQKGSLWLSLVSLFPPTYKDRVNGNRIDLSQILADMKPGFLRFPGGNYVEGSSFEDRWNWKATIGPLEDRAGHRSPWNYRSSDGMGLLEFLGWCEDLNMEPVLAVYAGLHLDGGRTTITGDALKPFVQEALDEIEYVTGDASTQWGARRVKDGHPQPFKLRYIEIGNEDYLNNGLRDYDGRFTLFYDAIKAKYPELQIISTAPSGRNFQMSRKPDVIDDHYYMQIAEALRRAHTYDTYDRSAPKIFVGEWATRIPGNADTCNLNAAIADAAFLTGLERNADVIVMNCYAPLFVNVNPGARQWAVDLIGFDALTSFGSPSYYVQKMFSNNLGDAVLPAEFSSVPTMSVPVPARGGRGGQPASAPAPVQSQAVFVNATRDNATGEIILKLVNYQESAQPVNIELQGVTQVDPKGIAEVLTGGGEDVNTIAEPMKVAPKLSEIGGGGSKFAHTLPAKSVTVLRIKAK